MSVVKMSVSNKR